MSSHDNLLIICLTPTTQFLSGLLNKFKKNAGAAVSSSGGAATSFATQVAHSLSQCVQSSDEYLKAECPICLDEPRVEDAVHSEYHAMLD